jgi:hypothetical protein
MPRTEAAPGAPRALASTSRPARARGRDARWRARQRSTARWDAALIAYQYDEPFAEREILLALIADETAPRKKREAAQARLPIADRAVHKYEANRRSIAARMWLEEMGVHEREAEKIACSRLDDRAHYICLADLTEEEDLTEFVYQTAADEVHRPTGDHFHVAVNIRPIRRMHCGGRRRPGGRRTSSHAAGGGSSGDPDSGEPAGEHPRRRADDDHVVLRHRTEVAI